MTLPAAIKISRPRFWIYLIGPYLIGLIASGTIPTLAVLLFGLYLTLPANLLIYGVNDIYDQETDRLNEKKDTYESRLQAGTVRHLWKLIAITNLPFVIVLLFLPSMAWWWLGLFLVAGIGYSAKPLRFKTRPGLDAAANILYVAPGFAAYAAASGQQPALLLILASLTWCVAMHAYSAVPDIAADTDSGTPTIATTLGAAKTILFCGACYLFSAAIGYSYIGWFGIAAGCIYVGLMAASYQQRHNRAKLFTLYKMFPYVNTALGAGLFFAVALQ